MCVLEIHMWLLFKLVYLLFFLKWIRNRFGAFKMIHLTVVFKVSNHLKMFQAVYVKISEPVVVNWHKWMKSDSFVCWKFYSYLVLFFFFTSLWDHLWVIMPSIIPIAKYKDIPEMILKRTVACLTFPSLLVNVHTVVSTLVLWAQMIILLVV